jgi:hypothetical protein
VAGGEIKQRQAGDRFIRSMIAICAECGADSLTAYKTRIGRATDGVKQLKLRNEMLWTKRRARARFPSKGMWSKRAYSESISN